MHALVRALACSTWLSLASMVSVPLVSKPIVIQQRHLIPSNAVLDIQEAALKAAMRYLVPHISCHHRKWIPAEQLNCSLRVSKLPNASQQQQSIPQYSWFEEAEQPVALKQLK